MACYSKNNRRGSKSYPAQLVFGQWFRCRLWRSNLNNAWYLSQWRSIRGLYLRKDKCELWSIVDLPAVDREVAGNTGNGFEVLGAAVWSPEFVSSCLQKRVQKVVSLLENLSYLDNPRCARVILRYCRRTPKLVYSLRTNTPTRDFVDVLKVFDSSQRGALDQILGTVTCDSAWKQCMPIYFSALGVRQRSSVTRLKQPKSESMRKTKIAALRKEFCFFLLLLSQWAVCQLHSRKR